MDFDRRQNPRIPSDELIFIQVEQDDGGRVLNVSEQGLCFEVFSTICVSQSVHFWFTFNLCDRIDARGRLVWLDAEKGIGGLRFIDPSPAACEQIRGWMSRVSTDANGMQTDEANARVALESSMGHSMPPTLAEAVEPATPPRIYSTVQAIPEIPESLHSTLEPPTPEALRSIPEAVPSTQLIPLQRHLSAMRSQFIRGVGLGVVITCAAAIPVFKYANFQQKSSAQTGSGQIIQEGLGAQPGSQPPKGSPGKATIVQMPAIPVRPQQSKPAGYSAVPAASQPGQSLVSAREATPRKKNSATPEQLWVAVQAGNAKAAVTLADLYLRGDGVPTNCAQARVLLLVASEKNNQEAIRKLKDLDTVDCPVP